MDENQNQSGSDQNQNLNGNAGGIPIKFNTPTEEPTALPTPQAPAAEQPLAADIAAVEAKPQTGSIIKKLLLPISIAAFVILLIIFVIALTNFNKDEGKAITQQIIQTQIETIQSEQIFTCNENQSLDSENKCICKTNYIVTAASAGNCVYDCDIVINKIKDLQLNPTVAGSTELASELVKLQNEAKSNNCSIPESFKTPCEQMQDDSLNAMASKDFIGYFDLSKKYIEQDCSKKSLSACDVRLAESELVNRILSLRPPPDAKDQLQKELQLQKLSYYSNAECNVVEDRCESIRTKYGIAGESQENGSATPQGINKIDPSNIFYDDRDYFLQHCLKPSPAENANNTQMTDIPGAASQAIIDQIQDPAPPAKRVPRTTK
jgi:hypothetical protein